MASSPDTVSADHQLGSPSRRALLGTGALLAGAVALPTVSVAAASLQQSLDLADLARDDPELHELFTQWRAGVAYENAIFRENAANGTAFDPDDRIVPIGQEIADTPANSFEGILAKALVFRDCCRSEEFSTYLLGGTTDARIAASIIQDLLELYGLMAQPLSV